MLKKLRRALYIWSSLIIGGAIIGLIVLLQIILYFGKDLPDYRQLEEYDPPAITRLYTQKGHILDEAATENRIYTKYDEIPELIVNAFIAAEDRNFFKHEGLDPVGIARAAIVNIVNVGKHKNPVGGSTITQQVVKNFLLTNERTLSRKIKEAILAYRISKVYSKEKIMELYLNQIYLGNNSYGIASAALNYFNKELDELNAEEAALLAALPKAPSYVNPIKSPRRARERRNWVLSRMYEEGYITDEELSRATKSLISLKKRRETDFFRADYYSETVRQELITKFGEDAVYKDGLQVFTNVNEEMQVIAEKTLKEGLLRYDKKHGYRGALGSINIDNPSWQEDLKSFPKPLDIGNFKLAAVLRVDNSSVNIALEGGEKGVINFEHLAWARMSLKEQMVGAPIKSAHEVLKKGNVILVSRISEAENNYALEQIPEVNGAIVVLEPNSGKVLAEVGGYSYKKSNFNRVTQADRQPGSTFKAFLYMAALENGYDPRSIVYDLPIELSQGAGMPPWRPKNMRGDYLGAITLRKSLEKSRNLSTVWLITKIGLNPVIEMSERLGIYKDPPRNYSMALGSFETKVLSLANAFNIIASGGKRVEPNFIDRVYDRKGKLIYSSDKRKAVTVDEFNTSSPPELFYEYDQLIDENINYQMISILEGVVQRGTAVAARQLKRTLAGKTGTTNNSFDTWFVGFNPDIVVGVYVGFDAPRTLGQKESGSSLALPIFIDFIKEGLKNTEDRKFTIPEGIELVEIDATTGALATEETNPRDIIKEAIRKTQLEGKAKSIDEILDVIEGSEGSSATPKAHDLNEDFGGIY